MSDLPDPESAVLAALDALGAEYERLPCEPELADTAAFCEHYGEPLDHAANTIVVASKKTPRKFAACVVLATRKLDVNRRLRALVGAGRLSFARPEHMRELTGMQVGGVTPFSLPAGLPLYLDGAMMGLPWVIVGTGGRISKLRIDPRLFLRLPTAEVIEDLAAPRG